MSSQVVDQVPQGQPLQVNVQAPPLSSVVPDAQQPPKPKVPLAVRALKVIKTLELVFRVGHAILKGSKEGLLEYLEEEKQPPPVQQTAQEVATQYGPQG